MRCGSMVVFVCLALGCDVAARKQKIPEIPKMPTKASTKKGDPTSWALPGDSVCPTVDVAQTTGAPGTTVRTGIITRDPTNGKIGCQVDGVYHGPATDYEADGSSAMGNYNFGQRSGHWEGRYEDGTLAWRGSFSEGVESGTWTYWHHGGDVRAHGTIEGGKRTGMWLYWDKPNQSDGDADRWELYGARKKNQERPTGFVENGKPVQTHAMCALGFSAPRCATILSAGLSYRRGPDNRTDGGDANSWVFEGDFIVNLFRSHGVGIGGGIYVGDEFARYSLRLSYRYWLAYPVALEASAGYLFPRGDQGFGEVDDGQTGRLTLNIADQLSLGVEVEAFDIDGNGEPKYAAYGVVRLGIIPLAAIAQVGAAAGK